jgi:DnaJ-domain-containing protein 1
VRVAGKPLSELTDRELEEELQRRRRARGGGTGVAEPTGETPRLAAAVKRAQVRQWYANLELKAGATVDDVRAAYQRLMARYHPDKHASDPEKHRAATRLAHGLTEAYHGLLEQLGGKSENEK